MHQTVLKALVVLYLYNFSPAWRAVDRRTHEDPTNIIELELCAWFVGWIHGALVGVGGRNHAR